MLIALAHRAFGTRAEFVQHLFEAGRSEAGVERGIQRARLEMGVGNVGDRADLLQVGIGQDRLAHFEPLGRGEALEVEQVRPRPDDRDEAHDQLLADRIDRRIGHLRKVLLEIGEERLRPVRQRRDRRVVAHRARGFLADRRHRRHQDIDVFLRIAKSLLPVEQRQVGAHALARGVGQFLELDLGAAEPFAIGVALRKLRLDLVVGNEAAFLEVDQQHLAGLQPPLGDDLLLRDLEHAHFGRHHDAVVAGDEIARGPQAVAVERGADLAAVGEGDRGGAVPRLHHRGVIFVEGAALLIHQGIAGPGFRNHHHDGVRQRVAALHQKFERVVEAGGVALAFIGDRPEAADVLAVEVGAHRSLPRRHPVDVAAQRVDLAVMRDHPVGMRQRPGREGVGREALMHQRQRALEIRLVQVGVVLAELVGEEHALVDHGAARHRARVIARHAAVAALIDRLRDRLAQDVELALEFVLALRAAVAADEDLHVIGLGRLDGDAERGVVGRHVAPAEQHHAFGLDLVGDDALDHLPPCRLLRHEQRADGVFAGIGQQEADLGGLALEEGVRDLHQDAGAVTEARVGADGAAVLEIAEDVQRIGDDLMRLLALDVGDEADAAGILLQRGIIEAFGGGTPRVQFAGDRFRIRARRQRFCHDVFALDFRPAHSASPRIRALPLRLRRTLGVPRHPKEKRGSPLVPKASRIFRVQAQRSTSLENGFAWYLCGARGRTFVAIPMPVSQRNLRQLCCPNFHHALFFSTTQARESPQAPMQLQS